jgi:phenylalanine-4-hydroxylase
MAQMPGRACAKFLHAVEHLGAAERIPRFDEVSARLRRKTRWEIVAVPGLIPEHAFFALLAQRRFPVTLWLRRPEEFDYIFEPDVFHDLFGPVPPLFDPVFADHMRAFCAGGLKAGGRRNRLSADEHRAAAPGFRPRARAVHAISARRLPGPVFRDRQFYAVV